jgi:hypothetical protein
MTMKLNQLIKIGILMFGISIFFTSCEKENAFEVINKETFDAPSIESAKQFVNSNSNTTNPNLSYSKSSTDPTSVAYWEGSKTKKYKETQEQDVDILYTPIYVNSPRTDIKGFIASTEQNGIVDFRKLYILYKSNDLSNGLSAYILIYGMDGYLQLAYNYENGQQVPLPEANDGNTLNKSSSGCDGNISTMTDAQFENWWANCSGIGLDEVVVNTTLSNPTGSTGGSTSAFNDWNTSPWQSIDPATIFPIGSGTNGNSSPWHTPNVTVANEVSISTVLNVSYNSAIANWLREMEQINQEILNQIADYLNANREENPFGDFTFGDIQPEQFPVSDEAIEYILNLIDFLDDTDSTYDFDSGLSEAPSFVGSQVECIHKKLISDTEDNFYKQMINSFSSSNAFIRFEIDDLPNDWGVSGGHITNVIPLGIPDFYNITISNSIENSSNISQMLTLAHELIHVYMLNSLDDWGFISYDSDGNPTLTVGCIDGFDYTGIDLNSLTINQRFVAIICAFNQQNQYVPAEWPHELFNLWYFDVDVYRDKLYELLLNEHDWDSESLNFRATLEVALGSQWKEKAAEYMSWKGLEATDAFAIWAQQNGINPALNVTGDVIDANYSDVISTIVNQGKKDCSTNN